MDYLGNPITGVGGVSPEDQEKLDAIGLEPSGEIIFDNGIIVNGDASELKTISTVVDDPVIQINRPNNNVLGGLTIKNTDDGLHSTIGLNNNQFSFKYGGATESTGGFLADLNCGLVNGIDVTQTGNDLSTHVNDTAIHFEIKDGGLPILGGVPAALDHVWSSLFTEDEFTKRDLITGPHFADLSIHREQDDTQTTTTTLWSSSKTNNEITTATSALGPHISDVSIHREQDDTQTTTTTLWSSDKTNNEITTATNALGPHIADLSIHRELDDTQTTTTNLWSSDKINTEIGNGIASDGLSFPVFLDNTVVTTPFLLARGGIAVSGNVVYQSGTIDTRSQPGGGVVFEDTFVTRIDFVTGLQQTLITSNLPGRGGLETQTSDEVQISGKYMTMTTYNFNNPSKEDGVFFFDISDPIAGMVYQQSMTIVDSNTLSSRLQGRYLYVLTKTSIKCYDIINPIPELVADIPTVTNYVFGAKLHSNANYLVLQGKPYYEVFQIGETPDTPVSLGLSPNLVDINGGTTAILDGTDFYTVDGIDIRLDKHDLSSNVLVPTTLSIDYLAVAGINGAIRAMAKCAQYLVCTTSIDAPAGGIHWMLVFNASDLTLISKTSIGPNFFLNIDIGEYLFGCSFVANQLLANRYDFSKFSTTYIGACDVVSKKMTTDNFLATNASVYGGLNVGGSASIGNDTLINGALRVTGIFDCKNVDCVDLKVNGDLTVQGTTTTLNTSQVDIEDPLIKIANGNVTNAVNMGLYTTYNDGAQKYAGLVRQGNSWYLFDQSPIEPTTTVLDPQDAQLHCRVLNTTVIQAIGDLAGTSMSFNPGVVAISSNQFTHNSVLQDTKVDAYAQAFIRYADGLAFEVAPVASWDSDFVFPVGNILTQNIAFNNLINTFTILHAGLYRITYTITSCPTNNDGDYLQYGVKQNLTILDESVSKTLKMKGRFSENSSSFLLNCAFGDNIRFNIIQENAAETIKINSFCMNVQRLRQNV